MAAAKKAKKAAPKKAAKKPAKKTAKKKLAPRIRILKAYKSPGCEYSRGFLHENPYPRTGFLTVASMPLIDFSSSAATAEVVCFLFSR